MRDDSALGACMAYIHAGSRFLELEVLSTVPRLCHGPSSPVLLSSAQQLPFLEESNSVPQS